MFGLMFMRVHRGRPLRYQPACWYTTAEEVRNIMKTYAGLDDDVINSFPRKTFNRLTNLSRYHLVQNCTFIKDLNFADSRIEILPTILYQGTLKMEHKVGVLREVGNYKPTLQHLYSLYHDFRKTVAQFKRAQNIDHDLNIARHVFDTIGHPLKESSSLLEMSEQESMTKYYNSLLLYLQAWVLHLPKPKPLKYNAVMCQSFRMMIEMLDTLTTELKFDRDFINKRPHILNYSAQNTRILFEEFKDLKLNGHSFMDIVKKRPSVLSSDPDDMKELFKCFKEYDIPESSVLCCLEVFAIRPQEFRDRFRKYMSIPELRLWRKHPRLIYLISHYRIVMHRLQYLRLTNRQMHVNVHLLSSSRIYFARYLKGETCVTVSQKNLRYILEGELGECSEAQFKKVKRHPFWREMSVVDIWNVLQYLKQKYTVQDIHHGIHLVLYPPETVISTLEEVEKEYSPENGHRYTPRQLLVLCVYLLEKENHFTGDAIWRVKDREQSQPIVCTPSEIPHACSTFEPPYDSEPLEEPAEKFDESSPPTEISSSR